MNLIDRSDKVRRPDFDVADFSDIQAPFEQGLLLCNPPYGERLGDDEEAQALYKKMQSLFLDFKGWELGVITSHPKFQECIGRYATALKSLKSGNLDTTFYIYTGAEKQKQRNAPAQLRRDTRRRDKAQQASSRGSSRPAKGPRQRRNQHTAEEF